MWPTISRNSGLRGRTFNVWKEGLCTHYLLVGTVQPLLEPRSTLLSRSFPARHFHLRNGEMEGAERGFCPCCAGTSQCMGGGLYTQYALVETPQRSVFPPVYLAEQECLKVESPSEMEGRARISACTAPALGDVWEEGYIHNTLWWGYVNIW